MGHLSHALTCDDVRRLVNFGAYPARLGQEALNSTVVGYARPCEDRPRSRPSGGISRGQPDRGNRTGGTRRMARDCPLRMLAAGSVDSRVIGPLGLAGS